MKISQLLTRIGISSIHIGEDKAKLCESIIKEYAKQVAEQALKDASENARCYDISSNQFAKGSILNTEIITP